MEILNVEAHERFIEKTLTSTPQVALYELIWNACDSDATEIRINFERNDMDKVVACSVIDNGCGINKDKLADNFGYIGISEKQHKVKSDAGRIYHGKQGKGRYNALSVATDIEWETTYVNGGSKFTYSIKIFADDRKRPRISDVLENETDKKTGTIVRVNFIEKKGNAFNELDQTIEKFIIAFAPYLKSYPQIKVYFENNLVDIDEYIEDYKKADLSFKGVEGTNESAQLIIISWKDGKQKGKLQFCDKTGTAIETGPSLFIKGVDGYLCSHYFIENDIAPILSSYNLSESISILVDDAVNMIKEYYSSKKDDEILKELDSLKAKKIYPYLDAPQSETEKVEQAQYKILAVEVNKALPQLRKSTQSVKKLTYTLLKEAIKTNADSFTEIINSIITLTEKQKDDLAKLLKSTSMPAIIKMSQLLINRSKFLDALHLMVYDDDVEQSIKERTQFQKILLDNLWIFGEDYTYGADDVSVRNLLKKYVHKLGRNELSSVIPDVGASDLSKIPDICLFNKYPLGNETYKNLVVEIKKPKKILGKKEYDQIISYHDIITKNAAFPNITTKWHFILIGKGFDEFVSDRIAEHEQQFGYGNVINKDNSVVSILSWGELIQRNKAKIEYLNKALEMQIGEESDILKFLHENYGKYVNDKID